MPIVFLCLWVYIYKEIHILHVAMIVLNKANFTKLYYVFKFIILKIYLSNIYTEYAYTCFVYVCVWMWMCI